VTVCLLCLSPSTTTAAAAAAAGGRRRAELGQLNKCCSSMDSVQLATAV